MSIASCNFARNTPTKQMSSTTTSISHLKGCMIYWFFIGLHLKYLLIAIESDNYALDFLIIGGIKFVLFYILLLYWK